MIKTNAAVVLVFSLALLALSGVRPAMAAVIQGWTIEKYPQPNVCAAEGPAAGNVELTIIVMGPESKLLISSPEFGIADGTHPVSISFDGGQPVALNSLVEAHVYGIAIGHDVGVALRSASALTVTVAGKSYAFAVQHADEAMDAVSRCAGEPTFLEFYSHPPKGIKGSGDWKLVGNLAGSKRCTIRLNGPELDTMIIHNKFGKLTFMIGHSDWAYPSTRIRLTLQIDDAPAQGFEGDTFENLVFVPNLIDDAMQDRLMHATELRWHLPWGDFHSKITGLKAALVALDDCDLKHSNGIPN